MVAKATVEIRNTKSEIREEIRNSKSETNTKREIQSTKHPGKSETNTKRETPGGNPKLETLRGKPKSETYPKLAPHPPPGEIRNSKYEIRNKYEGQSTKPLEIPKCEIRNRAPAGSRRFRTFGLRPFVLVLDFEIRISNFNRLSFQPKGHGRSL
jgi:hypothetical protein